MSTWHTLRDTALLSFLHTTTIVVTTTTTTLATTTFSTTSSSPLQTRPGHTHSRFVLLYLLDTRGVNIFNVYKKTRYPRGLIAVVVRSLARVEEEEEAGQDACATTRPLRAPAGR